MERLVVLDTETTGLDAENGHKIIEIGCVEIINRNITSNIFHEYINPMREIDERAIEIHGITNDKLKDKPIFADVSMKFIEYLSNSPLIIHNALFDLGFLKLEFESSNNDSSILEKDREILDTLKIAREKFPGKRNSLDALCSRYEIDNTDRNYHGALLDAKLLANVYLRMTRGQTKIEGLTERFIEVNNENIVNIKNRKERIIQANKEEIELHKNYFK
jgi:DNA polymerase-3 subunit epsilon